MCVYMCVLIWSSLPSMEPIIQNSNHTKCGSPHENSTPLPLPTTNVMSTPLTIKVPYTLFHVYYHLRILTIIYMVMFARLRLNIKGETVQMLLPLEANTHKTMSIAGTLE